MAQRSENSIVTPVVTKKQLAILMGVAETTLTTWSHNGMPYVKTSKGKANLYNVPEVVKWREAYYANTLYGNVEQGGQEKYNYKQQEARLKKFQADKAELELKKARGGAFDVEEMTDLILQIAFEFGMGLDSIGGRVADDLSLIDDPALIRQRIFEEARLIRNETADVIQSWAENALTHWDEQQQQTVKQADSDAEFDEDFSPTGGGGSESPDPEEYGFMG